MTETSWSGARAPDGTPNEPEGDKPTLAERDAGEETAEEQAEGVPLTPQSEEFVQQTQPGIPVQTGEAGQQTPEIENFEADPNPRTRTTKK